MTKNAPEAQPLAHTVLEDEASRLSSQHQGVRHQTEDGRGCLDAQQMEEVEQTSVSMAKQGASLRSVGAPAGNDNAKQREEEELKATAVMV